jgi:hypothetical protein
MSARSNKPTSKGVPPGPVGDHQKTAIFDSGKHPRQPPQHEDGAPTVVDPPRPPIVHAVSKKETSAPIQAISMKTPGGQHAVAGPTNPPTPMLARPKLRAMSEVAPPRQESLGYVAPPYDPKEARARTVREYVIWGCLAVILASGIALVVWFAAR